MCEVLRVTEVIILCKHSYAGLMSAVPWTSLDTDPPAGRPASTTTAMMACDPPLPYKLRST